MTAVSPSLLSLFPVGLPPEHPVSIGIIGLGGVARNAHIPACAALRDAGWPLRITAACDSIPERVAAVTALFPECRHARSADEIIGARDIDGILVLTPPSVSLSLTRQALFAGKMVLVEKPVACDSIALTQCIEELGGLSSHAQVAYNRRFQPLGLVARHELETMGPISQVTARLWRAARSRGDFYEDVPVHALDWLGSQFGELEIEECLASPSVQPGGLATSLELKLSCAAGASFQIEVRPATGLTEEVYVYKTSAGTVTLGYLVHEATRSVAPAELRIQRVGFSGPTLLYEKDDLSLADANLLRGFVHQAAAFVRFVAGPNLSSPCTLTDALLALRLSEQINRRMKTDAGEPAPK